MGSLSPVLPRERLHYTALARICQGVFEKNLAGQIEHIT